MTDFREPRLGTPSIGWASERTRSPWRNRIILGIFAGVMLGLFWNPSVTLTAITACVAFASVVFSIMRLAACLTPKPAHIHPIKENIDLPKYTALVPLFREANMVERLLANLKELDYPSDKLQILLICEAIDPDTIEAVRAHLRAPFELIIVPPGSPQTKPRALNYAMEFATGALVTIYDAEDRPHPQQLRQAVAAFRKNPNWAALQAPLDYFNSDANWLTRQFALEYAALFHVWVPFLSRLRLPFPLGGTSNHMRREALGQVGGWDAHNVTEDADLSFRLAAYGLDIGYINIPTEEEAVSNWGAWNLQRSRWIKGFMQSWDVHMRAPMLPQGLSGLRRFLTLQLTLGFTLLSIWFYTPTLIFAIIWGGILWATDSASPIPSYFIIAALFSIGTGCVIGIIGAVRARKPKLIFSILYMPLYWAMLFWPSLRAIAEMRRAPFFWHKTQHGVSPPQRHASPTLTRDTLHHEPIG